MARRTRKRTNRRNPRKRVSRKRVSRKRVSRKRVSRKRVSRRKVGGMRFWADPVDGAPATGPAGAAGGQGPPEGQQPMGWGAAALGAVSAGVDMVKSTKRAALSQTDRKNTPGGKQCVVCGKNWTKYDSSQRKIHCKNSVGLGVGGAHLDHWFCRDSPICGSLTPTEVQAAREAGSMYPFKGVPGWCSICNQSPEKGKVEVRPNPLWLEGFKRDIKENNIHQIEIPLWATDYAIWNTPGNFYKKLLKYEEGVFQGTWMKEGGNVSRYPDPPRFSFPQMKAQWLNYEDHAPNGGQGAFKKAMVPENFHYVLARSVGKPTELTRVNKDFIETSWGKWSSTLITPCSNEVQTTSITGDTVHIDFGERWITPSAMGGYSVFPIAREEERDGVMTQTYGFPILNKDMMWGKFVECISEGADGVRETIDSPPKEVAKPAPERMSGTTPLLETDLDHGKLVISKGDVLNFGRYMGWKHKETAVVNAANPGGLGGGGVDAAFVSGGGANLARDRLELEVLKNDDGSNLSYPAETGLPAYDEVRIRFGDAVITGPGDYGIIPASYVIHAVGPNYKGKPQENFQGLDEQLLTTYVKAMQLAEANGIKYLGFCLLSAGVFRGLQTLENVLGIAVQAIKDNAYKGLEEVHLIAFSDTEKEILMRIIQGVGESHDESALAETAPAGAEPEPESDDTEGLKWEYNGGNMVPYSYFQGLYGPEALEMWREALSEKP